MELSPLRWWWMPFRGWCRAYWARVSQRWTNLLLMGCLNIRSTPGRLSSEGGKYRRCCSRVITPLLKRGESGKQKDEPGSGRELAGTNGLADPAQHTVWTTSKTIAKPKTERKSRERRRLWKKGQEAAMTDTQARNSLFCPRQRMDQRRTFCVTAAAVRSRQAEEFRLK